MAEELTPIEPCGADWHGNPCVLPKGHKEKYHQSMILLPADVGRMIDEHITAMDAAKRRYQISMRWLIVATGLNLVGAMWSLWLVFSNI